MAIVPVKENPLTVFSPLLPSTPLPFLPPSQAYRIDAEKAISALNGLIINKRDIKVRYAASSTSVKVSNLNPLVSNELLAEAFSQFGEVESAVVVSDDRGKSLGYGVVDFARKNQAMSAIQHCKNDHFLLTRWVTSAALTCVDGVVLMSSCLCCAACV